MRWKKEKLYVNPFACTHKMFAFPQETMNTYNIYFYSSKNPENMRLWFPEKLCSSVSKVSWRNAKAESKSKH